MSLTEVEVEGGSWGTRGKACEGACQLSDIEGNVGTSGIMRSQIFARGLGVLNLGYRVARCIFTFPSEGLATRGKSCFTVHIISFFHVVTM